MIYVCKYTYISDILRIFLEFYDLLRRYDRHLRIDDRRRCVQIFEFDSNLAVRKRGFSPNFDAIFNEGITGTIFYISNLVYEFN